MQPVRTKGKTGFSRKTALLVSVAVLLALSAALYFLLRPAEPTVTGEGGKEQLYVVLHSLALDEHLEAVESAGLDRECG